MPLKPKIRTVLILLLSFFYVFGFGQNTLSDGVEVHTSEVINQSQTFMRTIDTSSYYYGIFLTYWGANYFMTGYSNDSAFMVVKNKVLNIDYEGNWKVIKIKADLLKNTMLRVIDYEFSDSLRSEIINAKVKSYRWLKENRKEIDANLYKQTNRFSDLRFSKYAKEDINKLPFKADSKIVFYNHEENTAGFICGRYVLGDYISFLVIYNFKKQKVTDVILFNTGFFME